MTCSVYFVSKLFSLFIAASIAKERSDEKSVLVFINQPAGDNGVYELLQEWAESPFDQSYSFQGQFKGLLNKVRKRRDLFNDISVLIKDIKPVNIFTGNDRRMEFQYAMHIAKGMNKDVSGHYMDEGTFTYLGRKAANPLGHFTDNLIKKMSYGFWWQEPETIGASKLINDIHVAFPEFIDKRLRQKVIHQLNASAFMSSDISSFCEMLLRDKDVDVASVSEFDCLVTLPYESIIHNDPDYKRRILQLISENKGKIAVKYHPRDSVEDCLNLCREGVTLLPGSIPFEAMLPLLSKDTVVVGDVSSTLLAARWLRPDLRVISYLGGSGGNRFVDLFKQVGIEIR
ncbi:polysialyltransferase family glycosyltransferase [Amphritea sp.]|uniref:polysialyltransferase family glycosyltransferase n=1 Tax=Amphritea sp. TaxID=1872502 RepID=UPI003D0984DB